MNITLFGATGKLGSALLSQCIEAGHEITVLARTPSKLPTSALEHSSVTVVQGDALKTEDVDRVLFTETQAILFAIGVDEKNSPQNLCTDTTRNILDVMRAKNIPRLVWCGGGSNLLPLRDKITFGSKFVRWYANSFLNHRHTDKEHQMELLNANKDICWVGIRPLQMKKGPKRGVYRLGYDKFSGLSNISFADCAHAMIGRVEDDTWVGEVPIVQY